MKSQQYRHFLAPFLGLIAVLGVMSHGITKEVPLGGLTGTVTMKENGKPLAHADLYLRPIRIVEGQSWNESDEARSEYRFETDENGRVAARQIEAGDYELSLSTTAHHLEAKYLHISEGKTEELDLEIAPVNDFFNLIVNQHVFTPDEKLEFLVSGFGKPNTMSFALYELDPNALMQASSLYSALSPLTSNSYRHQTASPEDVGKKVFSQSSSLVARDVEGVFNQSIAIPKVRQGMYFLESTFAGQKQSTWVSVTNLALVSKEAEGKFQVFATDIRSGKPIENVELSYGSKGAFRTVGRTGPDGLAKFFLDSKDIDAGVLMGRAGASVAFVNLQVSRSAAYRVMAYFYTDRPVYRPGDDVFYKGIFRELVGTSYRLGKFPSVEVEIRDSEENLVSQETKTLSPTGTLSGTIHVGKEAVPGSFRIRVKLRGEEYSHYFTIASYRKPEFSIKVEPAKTLTYLGDTAEATVQCEYFFGGPVQDAEVSATILRTPIWRMGDGVEDEYDDEEYSNYYGGEYVTDVTAETDSSGRCRLRFPTLPEKENSTDENADNSFDYKYEITVNVTEKSGKYFSGSGSMSVVRSAVAVDVSTDRWIAKTGETIDVMLSSFDTATQKPLPNQEVEVEAGFLVWEGRTATFRPFAKKRFTTNAKGHFPLVLRPTRGGDLEIRCHVVDSHGRPSDSSASVWIDNLGDTYGYGLAKGAEWSIKLDKRSYQPGETARLLIQSETVPDSAWLTIEGDRIEGSEVIQFKKGSTVIDLPIEAAYLPTSYVNVVFVKDKKLFYRERRLSVSVAAKHLNVEIRSQRAVYKPGDTAQYGIRTTDHAGKPVSADVSFGLVDESIYAIQRDQTDIEDGFYPRRYNSVRTSYSFEEIYLDGGDKAPSNIEIRKKFKDTAYWIPNLRTDANGNASVKLKLPDNLTSWRATVVAISDDTSVGQATQNVKAQKPLMVRLQAPSFLTEGDQPAVYALVTNDTGKDAEVYLQLDAKALKLNGNLKQKRVIGNGQTARFAFQADATTTGEAVLTARTWISDNITDGVELKLPVKPFGRLYATSFTGSIGTEQRLTLTLRENVDVNSGRLKIRAMPSLAGNLLAALDELIDFPYGCVEQTMSRFLPTVVVSQSVQRLGLPAPAKAQQIPEMVSQGLARLRKMQHSDGGWGWWEYDDSDGYMTGYVLEGLAVAKDSGYTVSDSVIEQAAKYAEKLSVNSLDFMVDARIKSGTGWWDKHGDQLRREIAGDRVQLAYGLALHGNVKIVDTLLEGIRPNDADAATQATMTLLYRARGDSGKAENWLNLLRKSARIDGSHASWQEHYGIEQTARALLAFMRIAPDDPLVSKAAMYLLSMKRGDMWYSTRDTSAALMALSLYLERTGELRSSGVATLTINGERIREFMLDPTNLQAPASEVEIALSQLKKGDNEVVITSSTGTGYYVADLRQTVRLEQIGALVHDNDLSISRSYFKIGTTQLENGRLTTLPDETPINSIKEGELVKVVVTLETKSPRWHLIIEDPIPSGCRIQDRGELDSFDDWSWWWARTVALDDRVAFFITRLEPGKHTLTYVMRAENLGRSRVLPTVVYNMYDPDARASSKSSGLEVQPK